MKISKLLRLICLREAQGTLYFTSPATTASAATSYNDAQFTTPKSTACMYVGVMSTAHLTTFWTLFKLGKYTPRIHPLFLISFLLKNAPCIRAERERERERELNNSLTFR